MILHYSSQIKYDSSPESFWIYLRSYSFLTFSLTLAYHPPEQLSAFFPLTIFLHTCIEYTVGINRVPTCLGRACLVTSAPSSDPYINLCIHRLPCVLSAHVYSSPSSQKLLVFRISKIWPRPL